MQRPAQELYSISIFVLLALYASRPPQDQLPGCSSKADCSICNTPTSHSCQSPYLNERTFVQRESKLWRGIDIALKKTPSRPLRRQPPLVVNPTALTSAQRAILSKHAARSGGSAAASAFFPPVALAPDCSSAARAIIGPFNASCTAPQAPPSARATNSGDGFLTPVARDGVSLPVLLPAAAPDPAFATAKRTTKIDVRRGMSRASLAVIHLCNE